MVVISGGMRMRDMQRSTLMSRVMVLWVIGALFNVALIVAAICIAWHFIAKFW
jgi:hypothetical protein